MRKDNIVSLGWRHVVCPLAKHADAFSWITFVVFLGLVVVAGVLRFIGNGESESFYATHYAAFWYGAWGLLVLSTIGPIFNIASSRREVPLGVLIGVGTCHVLVFILMSVIVLVQAKKPEAVTGLLAAVAAAVMVGIGWVVQYQSGARASRRAHTFNVLMQSRLSVEFQNHVRSRIKNYPAGVEISAEDARLFYKAGLVEAQASMSRKLKDDLIHAKNEHHEEIKKAYDTEMELLVSKYESLQSIKYLLNFYEFICAGLRMKELDEPLLRATLSDVAVGLYRDTLHIRLHAQKHQPDAFTELDRRMPRNKWLEIEVPAFSKPDGK